MTDLREKHPTLFWSGMAISLCLTTFLTLVAKVGHGGGLFLLGPRGAAEWDLALSPAQWAACTWLFPVVGTVSILALVGVVMGWVGCIRLRNGRLVLALVTAVCLAVAAPGLGIGFFGAVHLLFSMLHPQ
jgi:hypothetical protein